MGMITTEILQAVAQGSGMWLAAHGFLTGNQVNGWVGSIVFLGGVAWSAFEKFSKKG